MAENLDVDSFVPLLVPCPFCGGSNLSVSRNGDSGIARWITCDDCEADGPPIDHKFAGDKWEALRIVADAWNKRMVTVTRVIESERAEDRAYWRDPGYGEMGQ